MAIDLTMRSPHSLYIKIISFNNETSLPALCNSNMYNHETTTSNLSDARRFSHKTNASYLSDDNMLNHKTTANSISDKSRDYYQMTTPTSSVNNRSRHETIISETGREASLGRTFHTCFTASIVRFYTNNPLYCFKLTKFQIRV